jgi:type I restriction enzyme S subunit
LTQSALLRILLPTPSVYEQRAIADFLDRETAQIDTLIAKQEQLIETLRERRKGVITHTVAPEAGGTEWYGQTPPNWRSARLGYHFSVVLGKMMNGGSQELNAPKAPYLAAGSIQPEQLIVDETKQMPFTPTELARCNLCKGDIVVVEGGAGYGRSHYLRNDLPGWGYQNHVARLRQGTGMVDGLYATYCLKACLASGFVEANNRTATLPSLSRDVLASIRIAFPPVNEQKAIVAHLDEQTGRTDALIAKAEEFIALSKERRSALITAAVTGEIDVRGKAA